MERHRLREDDGSGAEECSEGRQVGDGLPAEGDGGERRGVRAGGRSLLGPQLLGEARGHGHAKDGLQDRPGPPGLRRGRGDGGCSGRSLHCLPVT